MSVKQQLAELFVSKDLPMEQFQKLTAFTILETEIDAIEIIQKYHLPEVTKLICGSDTLLEQPWATGYRTISPFCANPSRLDPASLIANYSDSADRFTKEILIYEYEPIISVLQEYVDSLLQRRDKYVAEKELIQKEIKDESGKPETPAFDVPEKDNSVPNSITAKQNNPLSNMAEPDGNHNNTGVVCDQPTADLRTRLCMIDWELQKVSIYLKHYNKHFENISLFFSKCRDIPAQNSARDQAYLDLNTLASAEEEFLQEFVQSGEISISQRQQLRDTKFCKQLLQCLEKPSYLDYTFPVLVRLYEDGAIDLESEIFVCFIEQHIDLLYDYLLQKMTPSVLLSDDSEDSFLLETALKIELNSNEPVFTALWNSFETEDAWIWIISRISDLFPDNTVTSIVKLISTVSDKASNIAVSVLYYSKVSNLKISVLELCTELLKYNNQQNNHTALTLISLLDSQNKRLQRKIKTAERQLNSQGQELFSSLYIPVEQLEELAIDLKCSKGSIPRKLVGNQLIKIIADLREGLSVMNLHTVEDITDWSSQHNLIFDEEKHQASLIDNYSDKHVKLRTLGFEYLNDEGVWKIRQAKVYTDESVQNHSLYKKKKLKNKGNVKICTKGDVKKLSKKDSDKNKRAYSKDKKLSKE